MAKEGKGVYIAPENRLPKRPEYLHMSKADVQAAEAQRRADDANVKAYREDLKKPKVAKVEETPAAPKVEKKAVKKDK